MGIISQPENRSVEESDQPDGILSAILILRFHDIKTLAPRGVNNS
ncbi:hypothetical protein O53_2181 [Microcystis aeruginosa TAIHU98]|uniref:Uncharacterized protein n=2 Tax=Microcystis aeruginosa TaxID=1126 RepID=L7E4Z0_MICAE|nr:hypothetical protein BH695_2458 [Microcystis aeruginosa PCC 7806SL]ELP53377.1 hypothetical protein O53_2181 [Microcystis aeruginosa TAIHU98]ELS47407.1 hypothetical protein C789_2810 [Microcystis aeruginosa FACHB-905 = DIANCHI905]ODV39760.1 hypothetical protein BFG60_0791 [Microcystis aeruginosa NIES-98]